MTYRPMQPLTAATETADAASASMQRLAGLVRGSPQGSEPQIVSLCNQIISQVQVIRGHAKDRMKRPA